MVPGLRVESVTVAYGLYELRVHRVLGAPPGARVEQTGWAVGPEEELCSGLHPLCGWSDRDEQRAPQGTAFTSWALLSRLSAEAGSRVCASLAALTTTPLSLGEAVDKTTATAEALQVTWADGAETRITFDPPAVTHA